MSALENYLTDANQGMKLVPKWTPVTIPDYAAEVGGFSLGINAPTTQLQIGDYMSSTLGTVWAALPGDARGLLLDAVGQIANMLLQGVDMLESTVDNITQGILTGLGELAVFADAAFSAARVVVAYIQGTLEENDERRYEGRLMAVEALYDAGPAAWADNHWATTYQRKRPGKSSVTCMVWPPDLKKGLSQPPGPYIKRSGDCSGGGSNLAPTSSSCKGSFSLYPMYMPLWGNRAFGSPGAVQSMRKGMERATNGGAKIWQLMTEMQGSMLGDPYINILVNAEIVYWKMEIFLQTQWGPALGRQFDIDPNFTIDPHFDENNAGVGYYYTPGHLIGAYTSGGLGSLNHPSLEKLLLHPEDSGASSFGGNGVRISDMNNVISSTVQFLALRAATVRKRSFCERIVDTGMINFLPEPELRGAIAERAWGVAPPPLTAGMSLSTGSADSGPLFQGTLATRPASNAGKRSGGMVLIGAAAAVTYFFMKK